MYDNKSLVSLFNTLDEKDKDIVITVTKTLVQKHEVNMLKKTNYSQKETYTKPNENLRRKK